MGDGRDGTNERGDLGLDVKSQGQVLALYALTHEKGGPTDKPKNWFLVSNTEINY